MPLSKADRQVSRASMLLGTGPTGTSPGTKQTSKDSLKFLFSGSLCLEEGVGPLGGEAWLVLTCAVGQWEFDLEVMELLDSWLAAFARCNLFHLHDMDGECACINHREIRKQGKPISYACQILGFFRDLLLKIEKKSGVTVTI